MRRAFLMTVLVVLALPRLAHGQVTGVWRGQSICAWDRAGCVDETVVYYISATTKSGIASIRADKIVNGETVTMGMAEWNFDPDSHTLTWKMPRQTWLLKIDGDVIEGTLTLADKTVVRRMTLRRMGD